jgi:hypothetical protein
MQVATTTLREKKRPREAQQTKMAAEDEDVDFGEEEEVRNLINLEVHHCENHAMHCADGGGACQRHPGAQSEGARHYWWL